MIPEATIKKPIIKLWLTDSPSVIAAPIAAKTGMNILKIVPSAACNLRRPAVYKRYETAVPIAPIVNIATYSINVACKIDETKEKMTNGIVTTEALIKIPARQSRPVRFKSFFWAIA